MARALRDKYLQSLWIRRPTGHSLHGASAVDLTSECENGKADLKDEEGEDITGLYGQGSSYWTHNTHFTNL